MEFIKQNPKLTLLAVAVVLTVLGAVLKVDVGALLSNVGAINKQVETLVEPAAPPAE